MSDVRWSRRRRLRPEPDEHPEARIVVAPARHESASDVTVEVVPVKSPRSDLLTRRVTAFPAQAMLLLMAVALVGAAIWLATEEESAPVVSPRVSTQVRAHVEDLLSYQPDTVLSDIPAESEFLTGDFAEEFASQFRSTTGPDSQSGGISADAVVADVGVVSADDDEVTLLMFVNVSYTTTDSAEASTRGSRLVVDARLVDGEWRITGLEPV